MSYQLLNAATQVNHPYVHVTANYQVQDADLVVDASGTLSVTLPDATERAGRMVVVKNSGVGAVSIATLAGQTVDPFASGDYQLGQWDSITVVSDGADWLIISLVTWPLS